MTDEIEKAKELVQLLARPSAEWPQFAPKTQPLKVVIGPSIAASPDEWSAFVADLKAEQKNLDNDLSLQIGRVRYSLEQLFRHGAK